MVSVSYVVSHRNCIKIQDFPNQDFSSFFYLLPLIDSWTYAMTQQRGDADRKNTLVFIVKYYPSVV